MIPTIADLEVVFQNLVKVLLSAGAFGLFIMLLIGGFKLLNSGSDAKAAETAKKTITYAISGFVLLAFSYMILVLLGTVTGTKDAITNFKIYKAN